MCCNNYFITIKRNWKIKKFSALIISPLCFINLQWGTTPWNNTDTDVIVKYPIAFTSNCYISLSTLVQAALDGKSASVQIGTFTNLLTEIHLLYTNTNLVSVIYTLRSYWLSFGK